MDTATLPAAPFTYLGNVHYRYTQDQLSQMTVGELEAALEDLRTAADQLLAQIQPTSKAWAPEDLVAEAAELMADMQVLTKEASARCK